jgi:hypothetical protein
MDQEDLEEMRQQAQQIEQNLEQYKTWSLRQSADLLGKAEVMEDLPDDAVSELEYTIKDVRQAAMHVYRIYQFLADDPAENPTEEIEDEEE